MLGVVVAVVALVPVACPWATYPLPKGADMRLGDPSFFHGPDLLGFAFSPDGSKIATASIGRIVVHDSETGRVLATAKCRWRGGSLAVSCDGKRVAWMNGDFGLTVFDVAAGKKVREIARPAGFHFNGWVTAVAFTRDGTGVIADYQYQGFIWMIDTFCWDLGTGTRRWHLPIPAPTFSPDGKTMYSTKDGLRALDAADGKERWKAAPKDTESHTVLSVLAVSADGERLVANQGNAVLRFDRDGQFLSQFHVASPVPESPFGGRDDDEHTRDPVFSPTGHLFAATRYSARAVEPLPIDVWDVSSGTLLRRIPRRHHRTHPAAITASGRYLWATEPVGALVRFDLKPPKSVCFDRARMWAELGSSDAGVAYAAAGRTIDGSQWAEMGKRFPPERTADPKAVGELLAKLSSRDFKEREAASAGLVKLGSGVLPALREFLKNPAGVEAGYRAEKAIRTLTDETSSVVLARSRLVSAVAMVATDDPSAREQLRAWAKGDAGLPLTDAARAALARLPK